MGNLHITSIPSVFAPSIKPHLIILAIDYKLTLHNFDVLLLTSGSFFCITCLKSIETAFFLLLCRVFDQLVPYECWIKVILRW